MPLYWISCWCIIFLYRYREPQERQACNLRTICYSCLYLGHIIILNLNKTLSLGCTYSILFVLFLISFSAISPNKPIQQLRQQKLLITNQDPIKLFVLSIKLLLLYLILILNKTISLGCIYSILSIKLLLLYFFSLVYKSKANQENW